MNLAAVANWLVELANLDAPAGYEDAVRAWLRQHLPPEYRARTDALGNVLITPSGSTAPQVLVVAPLDEVGFVAQTSAQDGWLRLAALGPAPLPGPAAARVRFLHGPRGVLTPDPTVPHPQQWSDWLCDVGSAAVSVGQWAVWDAPAEAHAGRVLGKAVGVRAALLVAWLALQSARPARPTAWVFATREQVPGHGSAAAAFAVRAAYALRIVPAPAADEPGRRVSGLRVGKGPALRRREWGRVADPRLTAFLEMAARQAQVTIQNEVPWTREPSWASLPLVAAGLPTATLSLPVRNLHAPHEAVAVEDVYQAARWLQAALEADGAPLA